MTDQPKPLVYLAGPYSKPDPAVNVHAALRLADELLSVCVPYVPHLTHLWHLVSPKPYEVWLDYDLVILRRCDALLRFGGESSGADREVDHAVVHGGIPVFSTVEGLWDWARHWTRGEV